MEPLVRSRLTAAPLGRPLLFETAHGLFSADRVDDGTRLLLDHLPPGEPSDVLDVGCGWGALGLPVAAAHPGARCLLVDRDLLAVAFSARNAAANALANVTARGSLGYREVGDARFDWVLCNVPARIGAEGVALLVGGGAARLRPGGEARVVVIRDLAPVVETAATTRGWAVRRVAASARHVVYSVPQLAGIRDGSDDAYRHDEVRLGTLALERPADLSEEPGHLREGLPLLLECLPRGLTGAALTWRSGTGATPITLAMRGITTIAADRDLLALTYARRNAGRHGVGLAERPAPWLPGALEAGERFALVVAEVTPGLGGAATRAEVAASRDALVATGEAWWLSHRNAAKGVFDGLGVRLATRGGYEAWRVGPAKG